MLPSNGSTQGEENPSPVCSPFLEKREAKSRAADAEPVAKLCLGMDSLLRSLKDAATMPHLHGPLFMRRLSALYLSSFPTN